MRKHVIFVPVCQNSKLARVETDEYLNLLNLLKFNLETAICYRYLHGFPEGCVKPDIEVESSAARGKASTSRQVPFESKLVDPKKKQLKLKKSIDKRKTGRIRRLD